MNQELFESIKMAMTIKVNRDMFDVCGDLFKDLKAAADNESLDDVEIIVQGIRTIEKCSLYQHKKLQEAKCLQDILDCTLYDETPGNILFENEDEVFKIIFDQYDKAKQ